MRFAAHRLRAPLFLTFCVAGVASDQLTKHWVATRLASPDRPLIVAATPDDAGRAVKDVVAERGQLPQAALEAAEDDGRRLLMRLPAEAPVDLDAPVFERAGEAWWLLEGPGARRLPPGDAIAHDVAVHAGEPLRQYLAERLMLSSHAVDDLVSRLRVVDYTRVRLADRVRGDERWLLLERTVDVAPGVALIHAENPGAAWGLFDRSPAWLRRGGLLLAALVAGVVIARLLWKLRGGPLPLEGALWAVASGGLGNAIDRVRLGYVVDFVDLSTGTLHWPTFNVADVLITLGAALLVWDLARFRRRSLLVGGVAAVRSRTVEPPPARAHAPDGV